MHGDAAAGTARMAGLDEVVAYRDLLTVGKCDVDPATHRDYRVALWKSSGEETLEGLIGLDELRQRLAHHEGDVAVWTTPTWSERCFTWHTIDQLTRLGVDRGRIWLSEPRSSRGRFSTGAFPHEELREAWERRFPLEEAYASDACALWVRYTDPQPLAFDEARRAGVASFPDLTECGAGHAAWFPWRREGHLFLSYGDQLLFDCLDIEWPAKPGWSSMLRAPRGKELANVLWSWFGDVTTLDRLEAWRERGAIERRDNEVPDRPWIYSLRLTPLGQRLRDEGVERIDQLPPTYVGGCLVNDPNRPWVRERVGDGWRLVGQP